MVKFVIPLVFIILLVLVLVGVLNAVAGRNLFFRDRASAFECGFDAKNSARVPFSLQFFLLAVIFLIFDVEVRILLPALILPVYGGVVRGGGVILFLIILVIGFFHEWREGSLEWL